MHTKKHKLFSTYKNIFITSSSQLKYNKNIFCAQCFQNQIGINLILFLDKLKGMYTIPGDIFPFKVCKLIGEHLTSKH